MSETRDRPGPTPARRRLPIGGFLAVIVIGAFAREMTTGTPVSPEAGRLIRMMERRLALMHDVARWKWANGKAIGDPAREAQVLDAVAERGRGRGLDPEFVRRFFAAQMEASKLIQQADFDRWRAGRDGPPPGGPDLAASRARIDGLDDAILDALATAGPHPLDGRVHSGSLRLAEKILDGDGIDDKVREVALRPLR